MKTVDKLVNRIDDIVVPTKLQIDFAFDLNSNEWEALKEILSRLCDYENLNLLPHEITALQKSCFDLSHRVKALEASLAYEKETVTLAIEDLAEASRCMIEPNCDQCKYYCGTTTVGCDTEDGWQWRHMNRVKELEIGD